MASLFDISYVIQLHKMNIILRLQWHKNSKPLRNAFKNEHCLGLLQDYIGRSEKYSALRVEGALTPSSKVSPGAVLWLCDRGSGTKMLSSEDLSKTLQNYKGRGTKELHIVVGAADGFSKEELLQFEKIFKSTPQLRWCFGPATYPHELAAVIASEQIYRALSIEAKSPYHLGH